MVDVESVTGRTTGGSEDRSRTDTLSGEMPHGHRKTRTKRAKPAVGDGRLLRFIGAETTSGGQRQVKRSIQRAPSEGHNAA